MTRPQAELGGGGLAREACRGGGLHPGVIYFSNRKFLDVMVTFCTNSPTVKFNS